MTSAADLLDAYDTQLRTEAEVHSALDTARLGPLLLATYVGGRGFVTYRDLGEVDAQTVGELVSQALRHYTARPEITRVEWKTRGHDRAPGLHEALLANGFEAGEPESIMIGEARLLAVDVDVPAGVTIHQVSDEADVRRMCAMQGEVFGDSPDDGYADQILHRLRTRDDMELWVAEANGQILSAGRLEPVAGTEFAGIWGGATRREYRGQGIYRALTAERARSAIGHGKRFLNSDSTEFSRPILERSGFVKVSTTTPYEWRRRP
jgi:hypothetical protein